MYFRSQVYQEHVVYQEMQVQGVLKDSLDSQVDQEIQGLEDHQVHQENRVQLGK